MVQLVFLENSLPSSLFSSYRSTTHFSNLIACCHIYFISAKIKQQKIKKIYVKINFLLASFLTVMSLKIILSVCRSASLSAAEKRRFLRTLVAY